SDRDVVLRSGGFVTLSLLDRQRVRSLHLDDAARVPEIGPGKAAALDRARRLGHADQLGERARTVCPSNRLVICALEKERRGQQRVGRDERRTRRLLLQQVDRLAGARNLWPLAQDERDSRKQ